MKENLLLRLNPQSLALVKSIGELAHLQGVKAYLVGGPVRDLMLKHPTIDLDITVEGKGMRLAESFASRHHGARVKLYPAFMTATVYLPNGSLVDFATARAETYARGGAFPAVLPSDIRKDLGRRDFTINAMAIAIIPRNWGQLIDPFGGSADLKQKRIRVLHSKSFQDDPTRILRAARFKERLGFKIEVQTLKFLKSAMKMKVLDTIKPQRYLKDFNKVQQEPQSREIIKCLKSWGAYRD